jgi:hypothetical protein
LAPPKRLPPLGAPNRLPPPLPLTAPLGAPNKPPPLLLLGAPNRLPPPLPLTAPLGAPNKPPPLLLHGAPNRLPPPPLPPPVTLAPLEAPNKLVLPKAEVLPLGAPKVLALSLEVPKPPLGARTLLLGAPNGPLLPFKALVEPDVEPKAALLLEAPLAPNKHY